MTEIRAIFVIVVLAVVFHLSGLFNGVVWDDLYFVQQNSAIRSFSDWAGHFASPGECGQGQTTQLWRPIRDLSYALDYWLWELKPLGYHISNLLLHVLNSVLLFFLARRLSGTWLAGFAAACIFAVHPVLTEAVAWIKGRDDLLATTFFLSALLCFVSIQDRPVNRLWAKMLFLALLFLGLLSKEAGLCLVPTAAMIGWWRIRSGRLSGAALPGNSDSARSLVMLCSAGLLLTLLYVFCRTFVLGQVGQIAAVPGSPGIVYPTMIHVLAYYFRLALLPFDLVCDYTHFPVHSSLLDPAVLFSVTGLLLAALQLYRLRNSAPLLVLGIAWFYLNLLPVANLVPTMQWLAERFLYLPMTGFCIAAGAVFELWDRRLGCRASHVPRLFLRSAFTALLMFLGVCTAIRNLDWRDTRTIMESALKVAPGNTRMLGIMGVIELNDGNYDKVIALLREAAEQANEPEMLRNLGAALICRGESERGLSYIKRAMLANPAWFRPYEDMGKDAVMRREFREAVTWFEKSVRHSEKNPRCWNNLALALSDAGDPESALRAAVYAYKLAPADVNIIRTAVSISWRLERWSLCEQYIIRLQQLQPGDPQISDWLRQVRLRNFPKGRANPQGEPQLQR